jgi:hypothetical protein
MFYSSTIIIFSSSIPGFTILRLTNLVFISLNTHGLSMHIETHGIFYFLYMIVN